MATTLLDPKNDFVFKRLFASAPDLLADLINAVRSGEAPIESLQVLNPQIEPNELGKKFIVLDVLARDAEGHTYNIEMQVRRHADWTLRSAYYLTRLMAAQLKSGEDYRNLKPVIGIHLMDFDLFEKEQAHWCFELRDRQHPDVALTQALQLHLIELPKADRQRATDSNSALSQWIAWARHWQEDTIMSTIDHPAVLRAHEALQHLSADEEAQNLAFMRERALRDEISELNAARREGEARGEVKGRRQQLAATVQRLLTRRFGPLPTPVIERLANADIEQLENWADRLLDSPTLEAVFTTT